MRSDLHHLPKLVRVIPSKQRFCHNAGYSKERKTDHFTESDVQAALYASDEEKRGARKNYRGPAVRKGARFRTTCCVFFYFLGIIIICRLYKLTLSGEAQVILQLRVFAITNF